MRKAFLSHNSADKVFVESIATKLNRDRVIFDKISFEEAVDFRDSIQKGLQDTNLFVLFASPSSLKAPWVKYELDEAELQLINGNLKNILIFLIGGAEHEQLPKWCQKKKVIPVNNSKQAARIIQSNLVKLSEQKEIFIGREDAMKSFTNHLFLATSDPQVLVFVGLEGQGRKSFARNVLKINYGLEIGPVYEFSNDNTLVDLYIQLLYEDLEEISSEQLRRYIDIFNEASLDEKIAEIIRILATFIEYREVPMIIDKGGFLNSEGKYHSYIMKLFEEINKVPHLYLALIQTRNPYGYSHSQPFFVTFIGEIEKPDMSLLLFTLLRNNNIYAQKHEIKELSDYLDGYPPAAIYATNLVAQKGMSLVLADKRMLTEFKVGIFTSYLKNIIKDDTKKPLILKVLGSISPIPYLVLETILDIEASDLPNLMNELIDNSIVYPVDDKYALASPLRESVRVLWGHLNENDYRHIAKELKNRFWNPDHLPDPIVIDILIVTLLRARLDDELKEFSGVIFPTSVLKAAKSAYTNNEWALAKKLSLKVLELDNLRDEARVILAKSYIRLNEHIEAEQILKELRNNGYPQYHSLQGFKHLKKREYEQAIHAYKNAINNDDQSKPVYRGIAECYYWRGDYDNAEMYINYTLNNGSAPNKFIVDLAAKIAIEKGDITKAEELIKTLEIIDRPENVAHRKAVLLSKQEKWVEALQYSKQACLRQPPLPEMFLTKAHIQIVLEEFDSADQTLAELNKTFGNYEKKDAYLGLLCKKYISKENWALAERYFKKLQNKNAKYYKVSKIQILRLKILDTSIPLYERRELENELKLIENEEEYNKAVELKFYEEGQ